MGYPLHRIEHERHVKESMPKVSIVIICMNRPDILYPCLRSICDNTACTYEIIVVAYMFSKPNLLALKIDWPQVRIIESNELRGFAENNNLALPEVRGEYVLILNDDTLFTAPVIDGLLDDFSRLDGKAAAVSPKILLKDGTVQTSGRGPWTALKYLKHYLHLVDETKPTKWTMGSGLFRTYTLNGACFMIRTSAFKEAGWFDERFTFTPEDIALGHKLNDMGYTVWSDDNISITHLAGATAGPMETAIKPTRVRGALQFYSGGSNIKYFLMGCFIWFVEALRSIKWKFHDRSDPKSKASIMYTTARNVMHSIFTRKSSKEVFLRYYKEVPR